MFTVWMFKSKTNSKIERRKSQAGVVELAPKQVELIPGSKSD